MIYSKAYIGAITSVLVGLTFILKVDVPREKVEVFVEVAAVLIGPILSMVGRFMAGGIHWSGFRLTEKK
jgi:hypothetical protein